MAITRSQQAKQMLQDGGMLVKPGFGGTRQGYRGEGGYQGGRSDTPAGAAPAGDVDRSAVGPGSQFSRNVARQNIDKMRSGLQKSLTQQSRQAGLDKIMSLYKKFSPIGIITGALSKFGKKSFNPNDLLGTSDYQGTTGPSSVSDDDDNNIGGGEGMPLYAQLGYPSQEAYMAAMRLATQPPAGLPAAVQPMQTMDLNRIAYRFMADGGFLDDEIDERQAYGLGSIVRKITRPIKKVVKKATRAVKKVAKSPLGRLAIAVAAPYALGPAMANAQFLAGLSAAQKAAIISGATTGITQLASGEDLDFKDIALSAAIGGVSAKAFPPGGKPGVDGKAFNASRVSQAPKFQLPRGGGADLSNVLTRGGGADFSTIPASLTKAASQVTKDPSLFSRITQGLGKFGGKTLEFAKENPLLTLAGASGLAGLMAKEQEQEKFEEMDRGEGIDIAAIRRRPFDYLAPRFAGSEFDFYAAEGGQAKKEPVAKKVMPLLDMGGMEKDYRAEGGFVPIGRMEKADDVPARLSKNEFVFTADAVRNAGDGDVDKGAEVMYNMMKNLEAGGDVSEESQGLEGARRMFQTSQRLEEVL